MNAATANYRKTTIFDVIPYIADCAIHGCIGVFRRVIEFPAFTCRTHFPASKLTESLCYPKGYRKLDPKFCEGKILSGLLNKVDAIKKKMGITKEVQVILTEETTGGECFGSIHSFTPAVIKLNHAHLFHSEEELDFTIAHELSHIVHKDAIKTWLISTAFLVAECAAAFFFTPWLIPWIEIASAPLDWWYCQRAEKAADLSAIRTLGTAQGAIAALQKAINIKLEIARNYNPGDRISPEGNDRHLIFHPPLTERLAYCQAYPLYTKID